MRLCGSNRQRGRSIGIVNHLPTHRLQIALLQPQIAPNTGNIARLCVATGTMLHLVRPLGFVLDDRKLRRSAMDYWPRLRYSVHDDNASFLRATLGATLWLFDSTGRRDLWETPFSDGDILVFGSETSGIGQPLLDAWPSQSVRISQVPGERCLNISTAVGIATYEALRKVTTHPAGRRE